MRKLFIILFAGILFHLTVKADITLEYCLDKAESNYPLIRKYSIVERTCDIELADINKTWLPKIEVYAQGTAQNAVPQFPESLKDILSQMGQDMKGMGHLQYKVGADISQTIWDGGATRARREIERASAEESRASVSVEMYAMRQKVMNLFFAVLLTEEQIARAESSASLLEANFTQIKSMHLRGVAMQSDVDMVEAQLLTTRQQIISARSASDSYRQLLSVYTGEDIGAQKFVKPAATMPETLDSDRPELTLFDARNRLLKARQNAVDVTVMPRIGFFAQTYYGYPGINYFESIMKRDLSFNILAGIKVSWNIDSFYTKKDSRNKLLLAGENVANDLELFRFNTNLQTRTQTDAIDGLRKVMKEDNRIVELRGNVRRAAESQLANGIIDATALLSKITDENQARLTASYHEIQLLQNIYQLRYILNR